MEENIYGLFGEEFAEMIGSTVTQPAVEFLGEVLPIALPVIGAIVVIGIGVKVFKRFVK